MDTASHPQLPERRKRRSRTSKSPDNSGDDGKKRGRPRVEKQDESAADRRRTQIRMAQRAYRQRKESTLEELRKRVSDLQNTIELMNKCFLDCRNRLAASGLPEDQLHDVEDVAIQYESLMKFTRNPDEASAPELSEKTHRESAGSAHGSDSVAVPAQAKNVPSWIDQQALSYAPRSQSPTDIGMGYTLDMQDGAAMDVAADYFSTFEQVSSNNSIVPSQKHNIPLAQFDAFRAEIPDIGIPQSMSPPRTYSFQESTFARRLHRASLEGGYQLLLDPGRRPTTYDRVFRLSLMSRDRAKLTAAMKRMLDRGPHEPLDQEAPLIHVGGAGTHFARRDHYGNLLPKKESWNLGVVGPQTLALLENAARDNLTTDMTVDIAGFEGEWFDPYDVEGYLAEKGIHIDPTSSFAEAEVLAWPATPSNASSITASSPRTPQFSTPKPPHPFDKEQIASLSATGISTLLWHANDFGTTGISDVGFSDATTGSWMNFLQPGESVKQHGTSNSIAQTSISAMWEGSRTSEYLQDVGVNVGRIGMFTEHRPLGIGGRPQQKRPIIIDVAKFVKVMVVSGVCLGRTPGFKRRDVDRALALSSFDAEGF